MKLVDIIFTLVVILEGAFIIQMAIREIYYRYLFTIVKRDGFFVINDITYRIYDDGYLLPDERKYPYLFGKSKDGDIERIAYSLHYNFRRMNKIDKVKYL